MIMVEIMAHYELYNNNNIAIFCNSLLNETIMVEIMARYQLYNNNILNNNAILQKKCLMAYLNRLGSAVFIANSLDISNWFNGCFSLSNLDNFYTLFWLGEI